MEYLQTYLDHVMQYTALSRKEKQSLISRVRPELEEQLDGQSIGSYEELEALLGAPEHMAEELSSTIPYKKRIHGISCRRKMLIAVICALVIAVVIVSAACIQISQNQPGFYATSTSSASIA